MQLATDRMIAEKEDGIGWMTFNNPERHNAISVEMRHAMLEILDDFRADEAVRVVVMKGAGGKAFVSGADISKFEDERSDSGAITHYNNRVRAAYDSIHLLPKPTIAAVHGACIAGGLMLAWCCDLIVAAEGAFFSDPVVKMGIPGVEFFAHPYVMSPRQAKEFLFLGERMSANEAHRVGMINRVVPPDALEQTVQAIAERLGQ